MLHEQSHAVSTAACRIYNYKDDIYIDSSLYREDIDSEDEQAEFEKSHDGSAAYMQACMYCLSEQQLVSTNAAEINQDEATFFTGSLYDSDTNSSNSEEQWYDRTLQSQTYTPD